MATKYLLHSDSATFDATSKKWFFNLEKRIANPRVIRLAQASFTTAGDTSPHPAVVYLRSDSISRMCQRKHTVVLQDSGHENYKYSGRPYGDAHTGALLDECGSFLWGP